MMKPGHVLRQLRSRLGYTLQDVAQASERVAAFKHDQSYVIGVSRLSDIEVKGIVPSVFKFSTLSMVYQVDIAALLSIYQVDLHPDLKHISAIMRPPRKTNPVHSQRTGPLGHFLVQDRTQVTELVRDGTSLPDSLKDPEDHHYSYGYVGLNDFTMYPVIPPGSYVRIDTKAKQVFPGPFHSEYARPVYFIETRDGFRCCWCSLSRRYLKLLPHQLSQVDPQWLRYPQDAEIVGRVVAMTVSLLSSERRPVDRARPFRPGEREFIPRAKAYTPRIW